MVILIRFIFNLSLLYSVISHIIINDDHHYNNNYSYDNVNHQKQYHKISSFHRQQHDQLSHRQLTSFDWKFYMIYNNDLQSVGINNESLATNHYNLYGNVLYMYILAWLYVHMYEPTYYLIMLILALWRFLLHSYNMHISYILLDCINTLFDKVKRKVVGETLRSVLIGIDVFDTNRWVMINQSEFSLSNINPSYHLSIFIFTNLFIHPFTINHIHVLCFNYKSIHLSIHMYRNICTISCRLSSLMLIIIIETIAIVSNLGLIIPLYLMIHTIIILSSTLLRNVLSYQISLR